MSMLYLLRTGVTAVLLCDLHSLASKEIILRELSFRKCILLLLGPVDPHGKCLILSLLPEGNTLQIYLF